MKQCFFYLLFGLFGIIFGASYVGIKMNNIIGKKIADAEKFRIMYQLMEHWMRIKEKNGCLVEYFNTYGYKKIAIYGMAEMGQLLLFELNNTDVEVVYGIDKNTNVNNNILILSPESELPSVDAIIVTAIAYYDEIEELLAKKTNAKIISLEDIVYEVV